jgi:hypothetical protein
MLAFAMAQKVITPDDLRRKLNELWERRETVEANRKAMKEFREATKKVRSPRKDSSRVAES